MSNVQIEIQDLSEIQKALQGQEKSLSAVVSHLEKFNSDASQFTNFQQQFINTLSGVEKMYGYLSGESNIWLEKITQALEFQQNEYPEVIRQAEQIVNSVRLSLTSYEAYLSNLEKSGINFDQGFSKLVDTISKFNNHLNSYTQKIIKDIVVVNKNNLKEVNILIDDIKKENNKSNLEIISIQKLYSNQLIDFKYNFIESKNLQDNFIGEIKEFFESDREYYKNNHNELILLISCIEKSNNKENLEIISFLKSNNNYLLDFENKLINNQNLYKQDLLLIENKFNESLGGLKKDQQKTIQYMLMGFISIGIIIIIGVLVIIFR